MMLSIFWHAYFAICISFGEVSAQIACTYFNWLFSYYWVLRVLCLFLTPVLYQICALQIFSLSLWHIFSFSEQCPSQSRSVKFYKIQHKFFSFLDNSFGVVPKTHHQAQDYLGLLLLIFRSFIVLHLHLKSILSSFL